MMGAPDPTPHDVAQVARRLTVAQRRALAKLDTVFTFYPVSITRVTIKRLHEAGMISYDAPTGGFPMRVHRLTPLGQQVREYLKEHK